MKLIVKRRLEITLYEALAQLQGIYYIIMNMKQNYNNSDDIEV